MSEPALKGSVKFIDFSASEALKRYSGVQQMMGKDLAATMRKVMRFWISFAGKKMQPANEDRIWKRMTTVMANYSRITSGQAGISSNLKTRRVRRDKKIDQWRGTYAAMLVGMLDWRGARGKNAHEYYRLAGEFARRRKFAAGLHRSGFRPALIKLRHNLASLGQMKKFRDQPGGYVERVQDNVIDLLVENWAKAGSPGSKGAAGLYPNTLDVAMKEVETLFNQWATEDIAKWAERCGLTRENK